MECVTSNDKSKVDSTVATIDRSIDKLIANALFDNYALTARWLVTGNDTNTMEKVWRKRKTRHEQREDSEPVQRPFGQKTLLFFRFAALPQLKEGETGAGVCSRTKVELRTSESYFIFHYFMFFFQTILAYSNAYSLLI